MIALTLRERECVCVRGEGGGGGGGGTSSSCQHLSAAYTNRRHITLARPTLPAKSE